MLTYFKVKGSNDEPVRKLELLFPKKKNINSRTKARKCILYVLTRTLCVTVERSRITDRKCDVETSSQQLKNKVLIEE